MLGEPFFRREDRGAYVKTVLICFIIWILVSESFGSFTNQRIELDDIEITGGFIAKGAEAAFPRSYLSFFLRMAAVYVDGAVFHPEVGVLAKVAPNLCGGSVVESPGSEAFFLMGPVFRNGVDLNKRRRVVRSALIEACP
jgi:hypothetical protein